MTDLYLTNSLTRRKERIIPIQSPNVGMYTCGPTVYDFATIGNFRTYTLSDLVYRTLLFDGYKVTYIMNITDVGHLTGDNLGDADTGEDRMETGAKREGKTAWDVAKYYKGVFLVHFAKLNLMKPTKIVKATDHIEEQIDLIKRLGDKGLTYKIDDGIYFDTKSFEKITHNKYGELSTLDSIKEGARVEVNKQKKNPRDFALWKFSPLGAKRDMEWESPWGVGFPGWHIECSAMSMKYLGESFDIHIGGEDLRSTHHPNEIAQSEGATGKQFVKYWVHGAFLTVDGGRMGKSLGNAYTVDDVEKKGFDPLALRYFYLSGHWRSPINFTWSALGSAENALHKIREMAIALRTSERTSLGREKREKVDAFGRKFANAINDDLNTPEALATTWEMLKSNIPSGDKYDLLMTFDEVLGLGLKSVFSKEVEVPKLVIRLLGKRNKLRDQGKYPEADLVRVEIESHGFEIRDVDGRTMVLPKKAK